MSDIPKLEVLTSQLQTKLNEAVAMLTSQEVNLVMKSGGLVSIPEVHEILGNPGESATTIYVPLVGDVMGDLFLFLDANSTHTLVDMMSGNEPGTTQMLGDFEKSALKELGNITLGAVVTVTADLLKISIMLTTPNLATDMAGALVDQVLIEYGENSSNVLAINMPFEIPQGIKGTFLLLFDEATSEIIKQKLE